MCEFKARFEYEYTIINKLVYLRPETRADELNFTHFGPAVMNGSLLHFLLVS